MLVPGPDGRPTTSILGAEGRLGWPLWTAYIGVFALTVLVGARLMVAVVRVAIANRRRRAHHRMVVDLVGMGHGAALSQPCSRTRDLRVLDVPQPLAYCLPGVRSRVVVSEGTLSTLADAEVSAILTHERAHLRARHDLVLEAFTAVHAAFPGRGNSPLLSAAAYLAAAAVFVVPTVALAVPWLTELERLLNL